MALQLRRGTNAQRIVMTPLDGELIFVTDWEEAEVPALWIGNGSTPGGIVAASQSLNDIRDVTLVDLANNDLLSYNAAAGFWTNVNDITVDQLTTTGNITAGANYTGSGNIYTSGNITAGANITGQTILATVALDTNGDLQLQKDATTVGAGKIAFGSSNAKDIWLRFINNRFEFSDVVHGAEGFTAGNLEFAKTGPRTIRSNDALGINLEGTNPNGKLTTNLNADFSGGLKVDGLVEFNNTIAMTGADTNIIFFNASNTKRGLQGATGTNDLWFVGGGADGYDQGYAELSTTESDDPIYVRQYNGSINNTIAREAIILDASGNTRLPGQLLTYRDKIYIDAAEAFNTRSIYFGVNDNITYNSGTDTFSLSGNVSTFNLTVNGSLTVTGTTTTVNSETVLIADNIITLNSNVTGTPTESAGIEVERGSAANTKIVWDEDAKRWKASGTDLDFALRNILVSNDNIDAASLNVDGNIDATSLNVDGNIDATSLNVDSTITTASLNVDSGVLYVDPVTNRVGINTTSPDYELQVAGTIFAQGIIGLDTLGLNANYIVVNNADLALGSELAGLKVKTGDSHTATVVWNDLASTWEFKEDTNYTNLDCNDIHLYGQLFATDIIGLNTLALNGNFVITNNDDAPLEDVSGFRVKRGSGNAAQLVWDDTEQYWRATTRDALDTETYTDFRCQQLLAYDIIGLDRLAINGEYVTTNNVDTPLNGLSGLRVKRGESTTAEMVWDDVNVSWKAVTRDALNVRTLTDFSASSLIIDDLVKHNSVSYTSTTTTANQTLFVADVKSAKLLIEISSGGEYQVIEILAVHNGTSASSTQYGNISTNGDLATFNIDVFNGNMRVRTTPVNADTVIKIATTAMLA